jgi:hypothetical protein
LIWVKRLAPIAVRGPDAPDRTMVPRVSLRPLPVAPKFPGIIPVGVEVGSLWPG